MTPDEKLCYSEGMLWRNRCKAQAIAYAGEVVRADPYSLIPEDPARSLTYHQSRVRVSQACLGQPDQFAQQNSAGLALTVADPVLVDDLGLKGAVINLWESWPAASPRRHRPTPSADGRRAAVHDTAHPPALTPTDAIYHKALAVRLQLVITSRRSSSRRRRPGSRSWSARR